MMERFSAMYMRDMLLVGIEFDTAAVSWTLQTPSCMEQVLLQQDLFKGHPKSCTVKAIHKRRQTSCDYRMKPQSALRWLDIAFRNVLGE